MKLRKTDVWGFHRLHMAWYAKKNLYTDVQITFGVYAFKKDGSNDDCVAEMAMIWEDLGNKIIPKLEVFDDAWKCLASFRDVVSELAKFDSKNITEEKFVEVLLKLGFKDLTAYTMENSK
jgi:hypothetical protein